MQRPLRSAGVAYRRHLSSRIQLLRMSVTGGINLIRFLSLRRGLLVELKIGGIAKNRSEREGRRKRRAGTLKNSDQVFVSRSRRKTEKLFSSRSRIFLNRLLFTIKKIHTLCLCLVSCLLFLRLCYSSFVYYKVLNKYKNCKIRMESVTLIFLIFSLSCVCSLSCLYPIPSYMWS